MKKLTSVVLSVLMVISLFGCLFTGTTVSAAKETVSAQPTNLINNGKFDTNVNTESNALQGISWTNLKDLVDADKNQWYRSGAGHSPSAAPDLKYVDGTYSIYSIENDDGYPTYFGPNDQIVKESKDNENRVLRAVQDLFKKVEPEDNGKYTLSFRFKLPNTNLTRLELSLVSPEINTTNNNIAKSTFKTPFKITDATITSNQGNAISITTNDSNGMGIITFPSNCTEWQEVTITFTAKQDSTVTLDKATIGGTEYTSPVFMRIGFASTSYDLTTDKNEEKLPGPVSLCNSYRQQCIYFDDFVMNEVVDCVGDAEFYDVKGAPLPNEQAYTNITTTVGGETVNTIYAGNVVTATVTKYDTESGAYTFLGWYKDDVLYDKAETITFTATSGETYTPHFGSVNLLGDSGSFENIANNKSLKALLPTDPNTVPDYCPDNTWGLNTNTGYFKATWAETIYDKDGKQIQQIKGGKIQDYDSNKYTVLENETIANTGSKCLYMNHPAPASLGLDNLDTHTDYKLSFYLRYESDTNKIKSIGITTTVNICNAQGKSDSAIQHLNDNGINTSLENAVPNHKIVVAKCNTTELNNVTTNKWQKMTINFNSGNLDKLYLVIRSELSKSLDYYIDDMVLVKMTSADVQFLNTKGYDITEQCTNEAKPTITDSEKPGYLVADATKYEDGAYDFRGWYNGNTFVSADKEFEFVNGKYSTLTAKVVSRNILTDAASFESYDNETLTYVKDDATDGKYPEPTTTKWGTSTEGKYFKDNWFQISTVTGSCNEPYYSPEDTSQTNYSKKMTVIPNSGDSMLRINTHSRSAICALEKLTPNTDYTLSFYVYDTSDKDYISAVGIADRYNGYKPETATPDTEGNVAVRRFKYAEGWHKVEISFNSGENATLYLFIAQSANTKLADQGASFVDDLVCYKDNLTGDDLDIANITEYKASNMRSGSDTVKQALRHKFEIKKTLIDGGNDLYGEVVEYGSIAVPTSYLDRQELVKDGKYKGKSPVKGVAYTKYGTDDDFQKIFEIEKDSGDITFTAALTGIGKNGDYATAYARSYTVRNYIIFKDSTGKETVVYGATVKGSVFDTMAAILDKYNKNIQNLDDQLKADYNTVKGILNSDDSAKTAFRTKYPDYVALLNN